MKNNPWSKYGGSAFPVVFQGEGATAEEFGMTLRDYFAAKAMQAMITGWDSEKSLPCDMEPFESNEDIVLRGMARAAYLIADAMLDERKKQ